MNDTVTDPTAYVPPKVWTWNKESGGRFASINRPIAGPTHEAELPVGRQKLLEHHGDLDAVRRRQRIELEWMAADRQFGLMRGARNRAIDAGKTSAALFIPGPDLWRDVFGGIGDGGIGH